ncbi:MAG: DUF3575 domain-containing protein [Bacteroides sp.]|nr:DUF3575 domain-containing protein [Bacteroides sp.]
MRKYILSFFFISLSAALWGQKVAIKNNLLYDATLTPNLGLEIALGKKSTLDLNAGYNPFTFNKGKRFKHWLAQPEYRNWFCEAFNGGFWGIHLHGGQFSLANLDLPFGMFPSLKDHRYEGYFVGGGLSIGYQWILSKRWNIETSIGGGYAFVDYEKYPCGDCGPKLKDGTYNYWGVTKATISFIYFFK